MPLWCQHRARLSWQSQNALCYTEAKFQPPVSSFASADRSHVLNYCLHHSWLNTTSYCQPRIMLVHFPGRCFWTVSWQRNMVLPALRPVPRYFLFYITYSSTAEQSILLLVITAEFVSFNLLQKLRDLIIFRTCKWTCSFFPQFLLRHS